MLALCQPPRMFQHLRGSFPHTQQRTMDVIPMHGISEKITLMQGDCLQRLNDVPDSSVDMVMADPPYGTTRCKWDSVIPLEPLWDQLKRVCKPNAAIVMTASQPFTSVLVTSNLRMFKYDWVYIKTRKSGQLNAKKRPLVAHESVLVFYGKSPLYHPYTETTNPLAGTGTPGTATEVYGEIKGQKEYTRPANLTKNTELPRFDVGPERGQHPTQKPVRLMEYLIKTYTEKEEVVLDFAMGSGTTGVACVNTHRQFVGVELETEYFQTARRRILDSNS